MLKIFKKLFIRQENSQKISAEKSKPSSHSIATSFARQNPISELRIKIEGFGHPDFPFLHKTYSPSSRIPCTDYTPFIIERLRSSDLKTISHLMQSILLANPGLGTGPEWINDIVREVAQIKFGDYVMFDDSNAELELKALFIIAGKEGGGREFLIAKGDIPHLFSLALSSQRPKWLESMNSLQKKANAFIRKMSKDVPFWEEYPLFEAKCWEIEPPSDSDLMELMRKLTMSARIHLLYFVGAYNGTGSLLNSTSYPMRSFGINAEETSKELLAAELCIPTEDSSSLLKVWSKNNLIDACTKSGTEFRKSWKKEKLFEALQTNAPSLITESIKQEKLVKLNPQLNDGIVLLEPYSRKLQDVFKLLCFI